MKICFVGLENLSVLAPEHCDRYVGGESVQQTLLARAMARRGHEVCMVVADYGQPDGAKWDGVRTFKAFRADAGLPGLRFIHPRWTGMWAALARADADVYYVSCAGMQIGLAALFCRRFRRRLVFRAASNADCDRSRLLVRYARDRRLYEYGLRRADAVLVQSAWQQQALARNYGLPSRVAGMLVENPGTARARDIDVLWVGNIRHVKRPDRMLELADRLPQARLHMVGGLLPGDVGQEALFREVARVAATRPNLSFHGHLPYPEASAIYSRGKILVNTSDVEGFPNTYLQAWIRGVPVVTLIDPDGVIAREGLGVHLRHPAQFSGAIERLLADTAAWQAASDRCRAFMAREYGEQRVLPAYLDTFERVLRPAASQARTLHA
ncbi:MAG: glycosyltransferase family 4 protein [Burkholderiales bacterium]